MNSGDDMGGHSVKKPVEAKGIANAENVGLVRWVEPRGDMEIDPLVVGDAIAAAAIAQVTSTALDCTVAHILDKQEKRSVLLDNKSIDLSLGGSPRVARRITPAPFKPVSGNKSLPRAKHLTSQPRDALRAHDVGSFRLRGMLTALQLRAAALKMSCRACGASLVLAYGFVGYSAEEIEGTAV